LARAAQPTTSETNLRRHCVLRKPAPFKLSVMRTLLSDPPPAEVQEALERRRRSGADRHDEVWEGVLHMMPTPSGAHMDVQQQLAVLLDAPARAAGLFPRIGGVNIGDAEDYRVPDGVLQRERRSGVWHPTAALVVEILSPGDETLDKLPFYAAHHVDELLIVDPQQRSVDWLALKAGEYRAVQRSGLIDVGMAELVDRIDWPPLEDT
jgi:Uma2 family endonuclease